MSQPAGRLEPLHELVLHARYAEARAQLTTFLARDDLDARERVEALELLAMVQIAERDEAAAAETLEALFRRDPGHWLSDPDASPLVVSAFGQARDAHPTPISVQLSHAPPRPQPGASALLLEVQVDEGQDAVDELALAYRTDDEGEYTRLTLRPAQDGTALARIPLGDRGTAYDLQYYVEARAPSRAPLANLGTDHAPLRVRVVPPPVGEVYPEDESTPSPSKEPGVLRAWWFWGLIGVVAVGAAVGIGVGVSGTDGPQTTLGGGPLESMGPNP